MGHVLATAFLMGVAAASGEPQCPPAEAPNVEETQPSAAMGISVGSPDLIALDLTFFINRYVAVHLFGSPGLPIPVTMHLSSETLATKGPFQVAAEGVNFDIVGKYGPQFGLDAQIFPFGGTFFTMLGVSRRTVSAATAGQTQLHLCPVTNTGCAQGSPVEATLDDIPLQTFIRAGVTAKTTAYLGRVGLGWRWNVGSNGYLQFLAAGIAKPFALQRDYSASSDLTTPLPTKYNDMLQDTLDRLLAAEQAHAKDEATKAIAPYDEALLPMISLGAGLQF